MQALPDDAPVLILLPGLTGGSDDSYVRYASHYAETHGTRAVVFNSRGCGDTFVTTPRYYSGLYIGDMQRVVQAVRVRYPRSLLFSAGWSLGANILTNYLGLVGEDTPLDAAAVMCNPFDLVLGSHNLKKGFNQYAVNSCIPYEAPPALWSMSLRTLVFSAELECVTYSYRLSMSRIPFNIDGHYSFQDRVLCVHAVLEVLQLSMPPFAALMRFSQILVS